MQEFLCTQLVMLYVQWSGYSIDNAQLFLQPEPPPPNATLPPLMCIGPRTLYNATVQAWILENLYLQIIAQ